MYPGGKSNAGTYQKLINLIPPHDVYIEAFLGGGAIMRYKRPARLNIGLERNRAVLRRTAGTIKSSDEAAGVIADPDDTAPSASSDMMGGSRDLPARNGDAQRWLFVCCDALDFLAGCPFSGGEFIYCDPPYPMQTRSSAHRIYEYEFTDADHQRLLELLIGLPCKVAISSYWSEMYDTALAGWSYAEFTSMTRGGRQAIESVWFNYPAPDALHDYRYLGDNYRERERIKRRKTRWLNRLRRMPPLERQAMLWALQEWRGASDILSPEMPVQTSKRQTVNRLVDRWMDDIGDGWSIWQRQDGQLMLIEDEEAGDG